VLMAYGFDRFLTTHTGSVLLKKRVPTLLRL
jgi:hypothetical protein